MKLIATNKILHNWWSWPWAVTRVRVISGVTCHVTAPALHNIVTASHRSLPADEAPWQVGYKGSWGCQTTAGEWLVLISGHDITFVWGLWLPASDVQGHTHWHTARAGNSRGMEEVIASHWVCVAGSREEWASDTDCKTTTTRTIPVPDPPSC